jgi:16S rRNA (cytosine967-C5)-methyltransferase
VNPQIPREIAARILCRRERARAFTEDILAAELHSAHLPTRDRALIHELVNGTVRWQGTLDWLIDRRSHGRRPEGPLRIFLRLGLYQLFWLDRIPAHAAVNETVGLVRAWGLGSQAAYANALLRGYDRDRDATRRQLDTLKTSTPSLGWSHPAWLVQRWQTLIGADAIRALLEWDNSPPATFARVNTLKTDPGALLERWRDENVEYDFGRWDWIPENLVFELKSHPPLPTLGSFQDGWFYAQDPSTLLAVAWLAPEPGHDVLDVCAAPGGKTTFIAQRVENEGRVLAQDTSPTRLDLLRANCARLGATCVRLELQPASPPPAPAGAARFDRILVDAPCSNTGVLRRRVDLRWRLRPEEIRRLATVQQDLLDRALARLAPAGRLVYSTCSLEPEENRQVVDAVLARNPSVRLVRDRSLHPTRDRVDGAYVAVLEI